MNHKNESWPKENWQVESSHVVDSAMWEWCLAGCQKSNLGGNRLAKKPLGFLFLFLEWLQSSEILNQVRWFVMQDD